MKNLFLPILTFLILLLIGCQENSITDPSSTEPIKKDQTPGPYLHDFISLESTLSDPYPIGNSYYIINGQIEYELRIIYEDPMLPTAQRYASLYFITNAEFRYLCTVCSPPQSLRLAGFISDVSEEFVPIGGNYVSLLEKTFTIQGREDGMVLKCRFLVTTGGIELSAMWLALTDNDVVAEDQINN